MRYLINLLGALCIASLLFSCAVVYSRESPARQPGTVVVDAEETPPDTAEAKTEETKPKRNKAW